MPRVEGEGKSLTIMGHGEIFNSKKFNTHMILSIPCCEDETLFRLGFEVNKKIKDVIQLGP